MRTLNYHKEIHAAYRGTRSIDWADSLVHKRRSLVDEADQNYLEIGGSKKSFVVSTKALGTPIDDMMSLWQSFSSATKKALQTLGNTKRSYRINKSMWQINIEETGRTRIERTTVTETKNQNLEVDSFKKGRSFHENNSRNPKYQGGSASIAANTIVLDDRVCRLSNGMIDAVWMITKNMGKTTLISRVDCMSCLQEENKRNLRIPKSTVCFLCMKIVPIAWGAGELTVSPRTTRFAVASGFYLGPTR